MPAVSEAQRRFLNATKGHNWVKRHHFDNAGKLPGHKNKEQTKEGSLVTSIAALAAEQPFITKLAGDAQIGEDLVRNLASRCNMPVIPFVKAAYADVDGFIDVLRVVAGKPPLTKKAAIGGLLSKLISHMGKSGVGQAVAAARGKPNGFMPMSNPLLATTKATTRVGKVLEKTPLGGSQAGRIATGVGGPAGIAGGSAALSGDSGSSPTPPPAAKPQAPAAGGESPAAQGAAAPSSAGAAPAPATGGGAAPAAEGRGSSMGAKLGLGALGVAGGAGIATMMNKRRKKPKAAPMPKEASVRDRAFMVMRQAVVKKAADIMKQGITHTFCRFLDKVAQTLPLEKTASVRVLQKEIAHGKNLGTAIKVAYPHMSPESRGMLAQTMVRKMAEWQKQANGPGGTSFGPGPSMPQAPAPQSGMMNWSGPAGSSAQGHAAMMA